MKRILIFSYGFHPGENYGGPVVSIRNFIRVFSNRYEIFVVAKNHDLNINNTYKNIIPGWNQVENSKVIYFADTEIDKVHIKNVICQVNPDIIYLNGLYQARFVLPVLYLSKRLGKKILLATHGELMPNAIKEKRVKKLLYIYFIKFFLLTKNIYFQGTSIIECNMIKKYFTNDRKSLFYLPHIIELPNITYKDVKKISGELKLVYIARIHPIKNLSFALECLSDINGKVDFSIYGPIEDIKYWNKCKNIICKMPSNIVINYYGIAKRKDIYNILTKNDAMILPTKTENYCYSIVEAIFSDCIVLTSNNTPWSDINDYKSGWAIDLKNRKAFIEALELLINMNNEEYTKILSNNHKYIKEKFNICVLENEYENLLNNILSGKLN